MWQSEYYGDEVGWLGVVRYMGVALSSGVVLVLVTCERVEWDVG